MKLPLLLSSLENHATGFPDGVAIITDSTVWRYGPLWSLVVQFEAALAKTAIPAHTAVAVVAHKTIDTLALMLALGKTGRSTLAVSPGLGSSVKPMLYSSAGVSCEVFAGNVSGAPQVTVTDFPDTQVQPFTDSPEGDACPFMLTTSGSTGLPKVVRLSEAGLNAFFQWGAEYFQLTQGRRVLSYAPLNFDLSLLDVWTPLVQGATVVLADTDRATQTDYLKSLVRNHEPDLIQAVPMFYRLLCADGETQDWVLDGPRHIVFTGDTTPQKLRERVVRKFPQATFHNVYGCTETNDSFVYSVDAPEIARDERLPLGLPISGVAFRIAKEDGNVLEGAGEGELYTSTPFLALGYTDPNLTTDAFYYDADDKRIYYRTGDRVVRDESGRLTLLGRNDFVVKVRGVRTNTLDIEQVLMKNHTVRNAVVVPVNDEVAGVVLHAVVEPIQDQAFDGFALRQFCAKNLPHTSVPQRFHLYKAPLPVTSTGKLDRKTIALSIQQGGRPHDSCNEHQELHLR